MTQPAPTKISFAAMEIGAPLNDFAEKRRLQASNVVGLKILNTLAFLAVRDDADKNGMLLVEKTTNDGAVKVYAIDKLGNNHYIVTADKNFDRQTGAGELTTRLGTILLNTRTAPNVIIPTHATAHDSPMLFLVDARSGRVTKVNAVERGVWPSLGRALNNKVVLTAADTSFYKGVFDADKGTFVWTKVGGASEAITFLGRVEGNFILGAKKNGEQIVVQGVAAMTDSKGLEANYLTVMQTIKDEAMPVGKIAGNQNTFAMFHSTDDGTMISFTPWADTASATDIVRAFHMLATA